MIYAKHPQRGPGTFSEEAWGLLGDNKGGWIETAKPSDEVTKSLTKEPAAKKEPNLKAAKPRFNAKKTKEHEVPANTQDGAGALGDSNAGDV